MYFAEKDAPSEEAEKFFNHYESNGWLVGGKSKMKNWQAAARNWLLNSKKFNVIASEAKQSVIQNSTKNLTTTKSTNLNATTEKVIESRYDYNKIIPWFRRKASKFIGKEYIISESEKGIIFASLLGC
jgi:4-alpha-glucanotransferase